MLGSLLSQGWRVYGGDSSRGVVERRVRLEKSGKW
jgi:hypothetical protein